MFSVFPRLLERLTEPSPEVQDPAARRQARTVATLLVFLVPAGVLANVLLVYLTPDFSHWAALFIPSFVLLGVAYLLTRSNRHHLGIQLVVALSYLMGVQSVSARPFDAAPYGYLLVPVVLAGALLDFRKALLAALLAVATALALAANHVADLGSQAFHTMVMVPLLSAVVLVAVYHRQALEQDRLDELAEREARFRGLLEASFHGVAVVVEGSITDANPGFVAMVRMPKEDVLGQPLTRFLPSGTLTGRQQGARANGLRFPAEVVSRHFRTPDGRQGHVVALQDISERHQLAARLHLADRLASTGQLAAGVAHEINNPLTWVIGNLDALVDALDGQPTADLAQRAADGARRIQRIVADLRTFSRVKPAERAAVDLTQVVRSAVNMARHEIVHKAKLTEDYAQVPLIDGDETRLGQVLLNMLLNAGEALPPGDDGAVAVRMYTDARGFAIVEVADTGPGIPGEAAGRIFEPFFTTKETGTGLGLSISRSIAEDLGGTLVVASTGSDGTIMRLALPPGALPAEQGPLSPEPSGYGRLSVLVVDDEPDIADVIRLALSSHDVRTLTDGPAALELIEEPIFPYDLVFFDLMMPNVSGVDLYTALRERHPGSESKVVFVTGGAFTEPARAFLDAVPNTVMYKPFGLKDLRHVANEVSRG